MRLARRYQGYGGTRFVEDDLAGDPEAGAPSIADRLRSTADGAQAAAHSARGSQPRSLSSPRRGGVRAPERAAPSGSGAAASADHRPAQGQRAQRGAAQAVEETAAVAAEESEVAVATKGVGGAFGGPGGRSSSPGAPRARLLERWLADRTSCTAASSLPCWGRKSVFSVPRARA